MIFVLSFAVSALFAYIMVELYRLKKDIKRDMLSMKADIEHLTKNLVVFKIGPAISVGPTIPGYASMEEFHARDTKDKDNESEGVKDDA